MLGGKVSPPSLNLTWQSTAVYNNCAYNGLIPFRSLAGLPLNNILKILAFKHNDIFIILINFPIGIRTP